MVMVSLSIGSQTLPVSAKFRVRTGWLGSVGMNVQAPWN